MDKNCENSEDIFRQKAIKYIEDGKLEDAKNIFNKMLLDNLYNERIRTDLIYIDFWLARKVKFSEMDNHYSKGLYLLKQWGTFLSFCQGRRERDQQVFFAIQTQIFSTALHHFSRYSCRSVFIDSQTLLNIGICYKNLGKYDEAITNLENANSRTSSDASILSQLADCYELENEIKFAKIFFREAFYMDPQKVNLDFIQSQMIWKLVDKISSLGYSKDAIKEWIPVYGAATGVLDITRNLKGMEIAQLKRDIICMEEMLGKNDKSFDDKYLPRLINRYIWLIDFYTAIGGNSGIIETTRKKIRDLNPGIYELFIQSNI